MQGGSALQTKVTETAGAAASKPAQELGGPVGGTMGTLAPVLAAIGTLLLLPGIVIAGPIAVALTAAGAVGVTGGLIGALTHWGIPKDRVEDYEGEIRSGAILMGVKTRSEDAARHLKGMWQSCGGQRIGS
jgi:hypothetical protein